MTMSHYFITGASSGIGAALAEQCLAAGDKVTAVARRGDRLAELGDGHEGFFGAVCDVTDADALARTISASISKLGSIDCAILNAGMYEPQDTSAIDPSVYAQHMNVNYMGVVNALPPIIENMLECKKRTDCLCLLGCRMAWPAPCRRLWTDQSGADFAC